jgi:hypothetical protein
MIVVLVQYCIYKASGIIRSLRPCLGLTYDQKAVTKVRKYQHTYNQVGVNSNSIIVCVVRPNLNGQSAS